MRENPINENLSRSHFMANIHDIPNHSLPVYYRADCAFDYSHHEFVEYRVQFVWVEKSYLIAFVSRPSSSTSMLK